MRSLHFVLPLLACIACPVMAQVPPVPGPVQPTTTHARMTWEQRFENANSTHDGHLTPDQVKSGYPSIARHFAEIDAGNKGYITEDDIRAWHKLQSAVRRQAHPPEDKLRPRHAFERSTPERPALKTSAPETMPLPTDVNHVGPDEPVRRSEGGSPG